MAKYIYVDAPKGWVRNLPERLANKQVLVRNSRMSALLVSAVSDGFAWHRHTDFEAKHPPKYQSFIHMKPPNQQLMRAISPEGNLDRSPVGRPE